MAGKIYLQDILPLDRLNQEGKVLMIRHYHPRLDEMYRKNLIDEYQSFQNKPAFLKCKYIVIFLGAENNTAVFYGIYEVLDILKEKELPEYTKELKDYYSEQQDLSKDFYLKLKRLEDFDKFQDRLVINWMVPRGWFNTYGEVKNKEVRKLFPEHFVKDFPGLMSVKLNYFELKKIIENPDYNQEWYESLTRLQAIYLILDLKSGLQYIGTTYGKNGLWQRWETYIKTNGTGENKELIRLENTNALFAQNLQFSILEVLPKNADINYCTRKESLWIEKLGTRDFGLNYKVRNPEAFRPEGTA